MNLNSNDTKYNKDSNTNNTSSNLNDDIKSLESIYSINVSSNTQSICSSIFKPKKKKEIKQAIKKRELRKLKSLIHRFRKGILKYQT